MTDTRDPVIRRLTALVILQAVLLAVALGAGLFGLRAYAQTRAVLNQLPTKDVGRMAAALERTGEVAKEATERQAALAQALDVRANQTLAELKQLRKRREALGDLSGGPIDKASKALQMGQLMMDGMLVMIDHLAWSQRGMAKAFKPLEEQRNLTGVGGAGPPSEAPSPKAEKKKKQR